MKREVLPEEKIKELMDKIQIIGSDIPKVIKETLYVESLRTYEIVCSFVIKRRYRLYIFW